MPISFKHKLIFIHIPKNAGTSITNTLNMLDAGHHTPEYYIKNYPNEWKNYKKFAVVRNPWDRVVSNYEYAKLEESYWHSSKNNKPYGKHVDYSLLQNKTFVDCVGILISNRSNLRHQGWRNQSTYLKLNNSFIDDIETVKFENLQEELKNKINIDINIPTINSSNHNHYSSYYTDGSLSNGIRQVYIEDVERFKYKFK